MAKNIKSNYFKDSHKPAQNLIASWFFTFIFLILIAFMLLKGITTICDSEENGITNRDFNMAERELEKNGITVDKLTFFKKDTDSPRDKTKFLAEFTAKGLTDAKGNRLKEAMVFFEMSPRVYDRSFDYLGYEPMPQKLNGYWRGVESR